MEKKPKTDKVVPLVKYYNDDLGRFGPENEFEPKRNFWLLVIWSSGSGKSNFIRDMLTDRNMLRKVFDIEKRFYLFRKIMNLFRKIMSLSLPWSEIKIGLKLLICLKLPLFLGAG